ncbi:MAG: hypothetical protein FJ171_10820 [Gammaproteobacteria bacterium]|nr:hypothetical protein [Gammaproteobacteria bacterium]
MDDEFDTLIDEYNALEDAKGGRVLNTDTARELEPEYLKDRTKSADVHEPASAFIKKLYAKRLAEPTPKGKMPVVVFTAGGTGAGKSSGVDILEMENPAFAQAELVYDTNMNKFSSALDKIDQALSVSYATRFPTSRKQSPRVCCAGRPPSPDGSPRPSSSASSSSRPGRLRRYWRRTSAGGLTRYAGNSTECSRMRTRSGAGRRSMTSCRPRDCDCFPTRRGGFSCSRQK